MSVTGPASPRPEGETPSAWSGILAGIRADSLDCFQTSVSVISDWFHGSGSYVQLGARVRHSLRFDPDGTVLEWSTRDRLREASAFLGIEVAGHRESTIDGVLRDVVQASTPAYVVGDTFHLPWLPYAGHEHMDHSFVLHADGDAAYVVDAYGNSTPYGVALPGIWAIDDAWRRRLATLPVTAFTVRAAALRPADPLDCLRANVTSLDATASAVEGYIDELREAGVARIAPVVRSIWLGGRQCHLHGLWLRRAGASARIVDECAARESAWRELATHSYVLFRRLQRGGRARAGWEELIDGYHHMLREDVRFERRAMLVWADGSHRSAETARVEEVVVAQLCRLLGLAPATVWASERLRDLPGMDSFTLVALVAGVEDALGADLGDRPIAPSDLRDVGSVSRLFLHRDGAVPR
jgi:hypothetical protein